MKKKSNLIRIVNFENQEAEEKKVQSSNIFYYILSEYISKGDYTMSKGIRRKNREIFIDRLTGGIQHYEIRYLNIHVNNISIAASLKRPFRVRIDSEKAFKVQ